MSPWVLVVLVAGNAREDEHGLGARTRALQAGVATADDFAAVYYNVAELTRCAPSAVAVDGQRIDPPPTTDHPHVGASPALTVVSIGACMQLPWEVAFGLLVGGSLGNTMHLKHHTYDDTGRFVTYGQRLHTLSAMLGLARPVAAGFSAGFGLSILADSDLRVENVVPIASDGPVENALEWTLGPTAAWTGALAWNGGPWSVGLTYRSALYHRLDGMVLSDIHVAGLDVELDLILQGVMWYSPQQAALGAAYRVETLLLAVDVTWFGWSSYPGPYLRTSAHPTSAVARTLRYSEAPAADFSDILVPRAGAEWRLGDFALRAGAGFRPSPIPAHRSGILDGHALTTSLGAGWRYGPWALDGYVAMKSLLARAGAWAVGGRIWDGGITVTLR
jgi:long-subunit fatty acid transport protein